MEKPWIEHYPKEYHSEIDMSGVHSLGQVFDESAKKFAHKTAMTCMGASITYRQYGRLASQLATFLQKNVGLKKGDRFAIMLPNVMQFPIAFMAAQKIGAICVNTNPLYTAREMRHQFKDSGAKAIIILNLFVDKLEEIIKDTEIEHVIVTGIGDQLPLFKSLIISTVLKLKGLVPSHNLEVTTFRQALDQGSQGQLDDVTVNLDDTALLQYTGGTTGVSKGASLTQKNILANVLQIQNVIRGHSQPGTEIVLTALPLYHIFALTVNFLSFFRTGEHMILCPKPIPIENTVKLIKKYRPTLMTGVNTLFNALNNNKAFQELAPTHIKLSIAGGMALQSSVSEKWQSITGSKIKEGYGLTEASPVTHITPLSLDAKPGSIGLPVASTVARVVNSDGEPAAVGEPGELIVKGPQVMAGYWNRPEETKKCLKDGWLWTGDMATMDEQGWFFIVDRKKDMIIVSGFNVFPNEVEEVIASHPKVLEAAVIGVPDEKSGEAVKAFVVAKDKSLTADELRAHCKKQLTGYKVPRQYEFKDELPKSNVGKILRKDLRDVS